MYELETATCVLTHNLFSATFKFENDMGPGSCS